MGLLSGRELSRNNQLAIAIIAIVTVAAIALIHFETAVMVDLQSLFSVLHGTVIPEFWSSIRPEMPILNVCFYLLGAIAVYLTGKEYMTSDRYVYFTVAAYLLYFPISGMDWSRFTTISLFPSLYLLGFYFYRNESRVVSGILFILSALTFLPFMLVLTITGAVIIRKDRSSRFAGGNENLGLIIMLGSLFLFLFGVTQGYLAGYYGAINQAGYGYLQVAVSTITFAKPLFFIMLLIPLTPLGSSGPGFYRLLCPIMCLESLWPQQEVLRNLSLHCSTW